MIIGHLLLAAADRSRIELDAYALPTRSCRRVRDPPVVFYNCRKFHDLTRGLLTHRGGGDYCRDYLSLLH
jgi:hypothetical protein